MKTYICKVPFIDDMGSISPFRVHETRMETKEEQALRELNSMRDHDGQRHLTKLPRGIKYTRVEE